MKETLVMLGLTFLLIHTCQTPARIPHAQSKNLVLEAIVEKVGNSNGVGSGFHAVYQLAKYRVISVCEGEYEQQEILVDHLILSGDELDRLRPNDRVRLVITKSNTIFTRFNEEGFRNADDKVETFYVGEKPKLISPDCKQCQPCE